MKRNINLEKLINIQVICQKETIILRDVECDIVIVNLLSS